MFAGLRLPIPNPQFPTPDTVSPMKILHEHKFQAHLAAFSLMILASVGMLLALPSGNGAVIWGLVALFAAGNILAVLTK